MACILERANADSFAAWPRRRAARARAQRCAALERLSSLLL
jgi:hypothetical protein